MGTTDPRFGMIIASIESNRRVHAMRFEPAVYDGRTLRINFGHSIYRAMTTNRCDKETAAAICATSWGMYQIMGFNLYGELCDVPCDIIHYCSINGGRVQRNSFESFCGPHMLTLDDLADRSKVEDFAAFYNGQAGRHTYADKILAEYRREYPMGH